MVENIWLSAFRIFIWGFSGVFLGLIILVYVLKIMSAIILKLTVKKEDKAACKEGI